MFYNCIFTKIILLTFINIKNLDKIGSCRNFASSTDKNDNKSETKTR